MGTPYITLRASNQELVQDKERTTTTEYEASGSGAIEVKNITGISDGDYLLLGEFGHENSEIVRVNGAPSGTTVTLAANTAQPHNAGTAVYAIDRNQVEFSRATTVTGSKSTLATVSIQADSLFTVYEDTSNTTGFGFYRFKNQADTTFTNYSASIPYAGAGRQTVRVIVDSVLRDSGFIRDGRPYMPEHLSEDFFLEAINDAQEDINLENKRWSYLESFGTVLSEITTGQDEYSVTGISTLMGDGSIEDIYIGGRRPMEYIDHETFLRRRQNIVKTTLGSAISSTSDTTITLTDSSDLPDSGDIKIVDDDEEGFDVISYTANDRETNTLSGVTNISETHANSAIVWYGLNEGEPREWTFIGDTLKIHPAPSEEWENYNIYGDTYNDPTVVTEMDDTIQFPANVVKPYVKWKVQLLRYDGSEPEALPDYQLFQSRLQRLLSLEQTGQYGTLTPARSAREYAKHPRYQRVSRISNANS